MAIEGFFYLLKAKRKAGLPTEHESRGKLTWSMKASAFTAFAGCYPHWDFFKMDFEGQAERAWVSIEPTKELRWMR